MSSLPNEKRSTKLLAYKCLVFPANFLHISILCKIPFILFFLEVYLLIKITQFINRLLYKREICMRKGSFLFRMTTNNIIIIYAIMTIFSFFQSVLEAQKSRYVITLSRHTGVQIPFT